MGNVSCKKAGEIIVTQNVLVKKKFYLGFVGRNFCNIMKININLSLLVVDARAGMVRIIIFRHVFGAGEKGGHA
jgi:hypothetical protein